MTTRRAFLASASALGFQAARLSADPTFTSRRPPLAQRKFTSPAVEARIEELKKTIGDPELAWMFENCFPNTLDTTVRIGQLDGKPDTFVITGDIDAMWLRDSTAQVWPYLPLARDRIRSCSACWPASSTARLDACSSILTPMRSTSVPPAAPGRRT